MRIVTNDFSQGFRWFLDSLKQSASYILPFIGWGILAYISIYLPCAIFTNIILHMTSSQLVFIPVVLLVMLILAIFYVGIYNPISKISEGQSFGYKDFFSIFVQFDRLLNILLLIVLEFVMYLVIGLVVGVISAILNFIPIIGMLFSVVLAIIMIFVYLYLYFASMVAISLIFRNRNINGFTALITGLKATFSNILSVLALVLVAFGALIVLTVIFACIFAVVGAIGSNVVAFIAIILISIISISVGLCFSLISFNASKDMVVED